MQPLFCILYFPGYILPEFFFWFDKQPWEVAQSNNTGSYAQNLGSTSQLSGDRMVPWWHRKNIGVTEPTNGKRTNFYHVMTHEQPVNTSWAPPQPPSFAMAGEASAIRYS